jgi:hypothetical protein
MLSPAPSRASTSTSTNANTSTSIVRLVAWTTSHFALSVGTLTRHHAMSQTPSTLERCTALCAAMRRWSQTAPQSGPQVQVHGLAAQPADDHPRRLHRALHSLVAWYATPDSRARLSSFPSMAPTPPLCVSVRGQATLPGVSARASAVKVSAS